MTLARNCNGKETPQSVFHTETFCPLSIEVTRVSVLSFNSLADIEGDRRFLADYITVLLFERFMLLPAVDVQDPNASLEMWVSVFFGAAVLEAAS